MYRCLCIAVDASVLQTGSSLNLAVIAYLHILYVAGIDDSRIASYRTHV